MSLAVLQQELSARLVIDDPILTSRIGTQINVGEQFRLLFTVRNTDQRGAFTNVVMTPVDTYWAQAQSQAVTIPNLGPNERASAEFTFKALHRWDPIPGFPGTGKEFCEVQVKAEPDLESFLLVNKKKSGEVVIYAAMMLTATREGAERSEASKPK